MSVKTLTIKSIFGRYKVLFDEQLSAFVPYMEDPNAVFIIDMKVYRLYSHLFHQLSQDRLIRIRATERNKSYSYIGKIYERITCSKAKRSLTLIGIGGGIIQDISGFIASTLYRGVNWIFVPTTLLAMADSCIGAKTSLNIGGYKNLIGSFYAPRKVILSTMFLSTLSRKDFNSGMGEIVKLFLIDGENSVTYFSKVSKLNNNNYRKNILPLIVKSLEIKKGFIEKDEFDKGVRNDLNFGHCIGHAIESVSNYRIPHGQAVTLGIIWANIISVRIGILNEASSESLFRYLLIPLITIRKDITGLNPINIVHAMKKDKKREGEKLTIILLKENFEFIKIFDLTEKEVLDSYNEFKQKIETI